jgi:hypothetical protein
MDAALNLQDLLRRAVDDRTGAPLRGIQARVEAEEAIRPRGMSLNRTTASQILRGAHRGVPSPATIRAIGWLAGVPDDVAFAAAGRPEPGPPLADELPAGTDTLDRRERSVVLDVVRTLLVHRQEADQHKAAHAAALGEVEIELERIQLNLAAGEAPEQIAETVSELARLTSAIHGIRSELLGR